MIVGRKVKEKRQGQKMEKKVMEQKSKDKNSTAKKSNCIYFFNGIKHNKIKEKCLSSQYGTDM